MGAPDRVNGIYPIYQTQHIFVLPSQVVAEGFNIKSFRNGFFIFWGATDFTDGVYVLEIQESSDGGSSGTPVPSDRIYSPQVVEEGDFDPLVIITPGGMTQNLSGVARLIAIKDFKTESIRLQITASGITTGADILIQVFATSPLSPTDIVNLPIPVV